jgi:deoxyribose-phosphate aldolase
MDLAEFIEYTRLKPDTSKDDVVKICKQAIEHNMLGVCIPPYHVNTARKIINEAKASVKVITVVGFPFGYGRTSAKVEEVKQALRDGADEIDAVINIAAVKSGDYSSVENDISSMVTTCHLQNKKAKLIFETGLLKEEEIVKLCGIAVESGADFVKTSSGMLPGGITPEMVAMLRSLLPEKTLIKASGAIRSREQAIKIIEAGAARLGSSHGLKLLEVK